MKLKFIVLATLLSCTLAEAGRPMPTESRNEERSRAAVHSTNRTGGTIGRPTRIDFSQPPSRNGNSNSRTPTLDLSLALQVFRARNRREAARLAAEAEAARVVAPGGTILILEFATPKPTAIGDISPAPELNEEPGTR